MTAGGVVTVATGADVTCTITNDDQAAHLTLVKTVTNDNGGTAKATDWTLTGDGPTPITGATGPTRSPTPPSTPATTPSPRPTAPTATPPSDWDCRPADQSGSTMTVNNGADVTCTINNNDTPPT